MHAHAKHLQRVIVGGIVLHLLGCGAAQPAPGASARPNLERDLNANRPFTEVWVSPKASIVRNECEYGAYDDCNAMDEDCNGVIDDGCDYESGDVQITVGWNTGADIDLYVTDPSGEQIYYNEGHKRSKAGGHLDHDARGDCRKEQSNPRIENAYWPAPGVPGKYRVELNYFSPCAQDKPTDATLSVVVERELLGTYRFRLDPEQRVVALTFTKR